MPYFMLLRTVLAGRDGSQVLYVPLPSLVVVMTLDNKEKRKGGVRFPTPRVLCRGIACRREA
jgi:hypothetical protein